MSNKSSQSPAGVKPPGSGRARKDDGGGGEPILGAGRGRKDDGGGDVPVPGAGRDRKCDAKGEDSVLVAVRGSQGDGGGAGVLGGGAKTLPGAGVGVKNLPGEGGGLKNLLGEGGGVKNLPGAGGSVKNLPGRQNDEAETVLGSVCGSKRDGGRSRPVPVAGRRGHGDEGGGKEGDGGAELPATPPPSWCSDSVLQSPPAAPGTEVRPAFLAP